MAIQDILDELQISKGAFYHYFSSKQDLLEALIERMYGDVEQILLPILDDPDLPAMDKLHRYFDTAARWKTTQKAYLLALLRVWYADENAIVRQKIQAMTLERIGPLLSRIVHQGIQEGVLTTAFPDEAGAIIIALLQSLGDAFARVLLPVSRCLASCSAWKAPCTHSTTPWSAFWELHRPRCSSSTWKPSTNGSYYPERSW